MAKGQKQKTRLNGAMKVFVVQCLARFMTPTEIETVLLEDHNLKVTRQAIAKYDPTTATGKDLGEEFKKVFEAARAAFITDISHIDVSHQSFRLRRLSELARKAEEDGKDVVAAAHYEQAAKEMGGMFTNRREISGPKGGPIQHAGMTLEEWKNQATQQLTAAEQTLATFEDET